SATGRTTSLASRREMAAAIRRARITGTPWTARACRADGRHGSRTPTTAPTRESGTGADRGARCNFIPRPRRDRPARSGFSKSSWRTFVESGGRSDARPDSGLRGAQDRGGGGVRLLRIAGDQGAQGGRGGDLVDQP